MKIGSGIGLSGTNPLDSQQYALWLQRMQERMAERAQAAAQQQPAGTGDLAAEMTHAKPHGHHHPHAPVSGTDPAQELLEPAKKKNEDAQALLAQWSQNLSVHQAYLQSNLQQSQQVEAMTSAASS